MVRIFTTQFQYNHQVYDAIITVIPKDGATTFTIKVLDFNLHALLPGGEMSFENKDRFEIKDLPSNQFTYALLKSISTAIEAHIAAI